VILVAAALPAAGALAQAYSVPPALEQVVGQSNVDDAGREAIRAFVNPLARDLTSGDAAAMGLAREDLIAPLVAAPNVSVSFRISYAEALMTTLQGLVSGGDEAGAVTALRIAGQLGTGQSVTLISSAIDHDSPAVRYAAAQAMGETLRLVAEGNPALQQGAAQDLIDKLGDRLIGEPDAFVTDALVRALDGPRANPALRQTAAVRMAGAMIEQIRIRRAALDGETNIVESASSMLRAIINLRSLFIDLGAGVPRPVAVTAGRLAGQAMTWGVAAIDNAGGFGALSAAERQAIDSTLRAAEALAALANVSVGGDNVVAQPIARALEQDDLNALDVAVQGWAGPAGRLVRQPFGADPAEFE
jgi:hypothetical protein